MWAARSCLPSTTGSRRRWWLALAPGAALALLLPNIGLCQNRAEGYLEKMAEAQRATYRARQLVVYLGFPQSAAVLEVRSTPGGTFIRAESGHDVTRVWRDPGRGLVWGGRLRIDDATPPRVPLDLDDVMEKYDVRAGEPQYLLGVTVVPLELLRRKDRRLVERLWINPDTGVVYRRELFGPEGDVVGMSTILDMRWGESVRPEPFEGRPPAQVESRRTAGAPAELAYGYRLVSSHRMRAGGRTATQWVYSDGLHALSVFRAQGSMRRPEHYRSVRVGDAKVWVGPGPATWAWEGGRASWVVVAEEPQLDPGEVTKPFPRGGQSTVAKMGAWWARAAHWVGDRLP